VTVTPEDNKRIVFNKGILIGLNELIATGGQCCPNSMFGEILLWKNPQKNEIKKNTSDVHREASLQGIHSFLVINGLKTGMILFIK